jgi:hypothetical protein
MSVTTELKQIIDDRVGRLEHELQVQKYEVLVLENRTGNKLNDVVGKIAADIKFELDADVRIMQVRDMVVDALQTEKLYKILLKDIKLQLTEIKVD